MNWQPINTAPTDETVVLTDLGTACYIKQSNPIRPGPEGWWLCDTDGNINPEYGVLLFPTYWLPIPELPSK